MKKLLVYFMILSLSIPLFAEKGKFHFDVGAEPEKNGSATAGMLQYDWSDDWASRLDIRYITHVDTHDNQEGYSNVAGTSKYQSFEIDILPAVYMFGKTFADSNYFSISAGFSYQFTHQDDFKGMFDTNGIMLDEGDEGKYFTMKNERSVNLFAPRLGFTTNIPLNSIIAFNFEGFVHPVYYILLFQDMGYHSDQTSTPFDYSGTNKFYGLSSPYLDSKLSFDIFRIVRIMTRFTYQKLVFEQMGWNTNYDGLEGKSDTQDITSWRIGAELLSWNKEHARIRAGVYYVHEWNKSRYLETTEHSEKWVLSLGSEL